MSVRLLVLGVVMALVAAIAAGFLAGSRGVLLVIGLLLLILLPLFIDKFVYIRVGEMETAVVFNRETKAFSRFLPAGRYFLKVPLERVGDIVSTAPQSVNSRCKNAQTQEGVSVDLEFTVAYELFPCEAAEDLKPKVARFLPSGATGLVRNHANNCAAQLANTKTIETLCQKGGRSRLDRELRDAIQERLRPFGITVHRIMVTSINLPPPVQKTLQEAHEHMVYAEREALGLERLQKAVSQFSDADMERLLQVRQLRELGQNGMMIHVPYLDNAGNRRNNSDDKQTGNGRSAQDDPPFPPDHTNGRASGRPHS